jgi:hypothetical protein
MHPTTTDDRWCAFLGTPEVDERAHSSSGRSPPERIYPPPPHTHTPSQRTTPKQGQAPETVDLLADEEEEEDEKDNGGRRKRGVRGSRVVLAGWLAGFVRVMTNRSEELAGAFVRMCMRACVRLGCTTTRNLMAERARYCALHSTGQGGGGEGGGQQARQGRAGHGRRRRRRRRRRWVGRLTRLMPTPTKHIRCGLV